MPGVKIDWDKRITDGLVGKNVEIIDASLNIPKGHKLILGDASKVAARARRARE